MITTTVVGGLVFLGGRWIIKTDLKNRAEFRKNIVHYKTPDNVKIQYYKFTELVPEIPQFSFGNIFYYRPGSSFTEERFLRQKLIWDEHEIGRKNMTYNFSVWSIHWLDETRDRKKIAEYYGSMIPSNEIVRVYRKDITEAYLAHDSDKKVIAMSDDIDRLCDSLGPQTNLTLVVIAGGLIILVTYLISK